MPSGQPEQFGKYQLLEKIATGGMAGLIEKEARIFDAVNLDLTLAGLRIIQELNT